MDGGLAWRAGGRWRSSRSLEILPAAIRDPSADPGFTYIFFYPQEKHRSRKGEFQGEQGMDGENRQLSGYGEPRDRGDRAGRNACSVS